MSSFRRPWPRRDYKYVEASVNGGPRPWSLHNQGITKFLYFVLLSTLYYTWWLRNTVFAPILPRTDFAPGRRPDKWRGGAKLAMSIFDKTQKKPMSIFACLQNVNKALKVSNLDLTMYLLYKTQKGTIWCFLNEVCLHQIKLWAVWLQRNKLEQEKVKFSIFIVCKLRQVSEVRRLAFMQLRNLNWISEDQNTKQKFAFGIWICKVRQWLARIFNLQNISHWWHWSWF